MIKKQKLLPDKMKILSGSALKVIAVVTMLIDHIASHLLRNGYVLINVFAFLLVEGFVHTRSRKRYGMSLFVCAVISELPWNLLHGGKLLCDSQNVFFTLLLGFLGMCVIEQQKSRPVIQAAALLGIGVLSVLIRSDYSIHGYTFIVLLYILREHEVLRMFSSFSLQNHWFALGALTENAASLREMSSNTHSICFIPCICSFYTLSNIK